jgi:hypothetical protein
MGLSASLMAGCGSDKAVTTDTTLKEVSSLEQTSDTVEGIAKVESETEIAETETTETLVDIEATSESETEEVTVVNWRDYQTVTINGTVIKAPYTIQDLIDAGAEDYTNISDTVEPGVSESVYWLNIDDVRICVSLYNPDTYTINALDANVYWISLFLNDSNVLGDSVSVGLITNDMDYSDISKIYGDADELDSLELNVLSPEDLNNQDEYWVIYGNDNYGYPRSWGINELEYRVASGVGIVKVNVTYFEQIAKYYHPSE